MWLVLSGMGRLVSDDLNCVGMWEDREKSCIFEGMLFKLQFDSLLLTSE